MRDEINTIRFGAATICFIAMSSLTFFQINVLSKASLICVKLTKDSFMATSVRYVIETFFSCLATVGIALVAGVTFGKFEKCNETVLSCSKYTVNSFNNMLISFINILSFIFDIFPIIGHVKAGIHYICGKRSDGDKALKAASRTTGIFFAAVIGALTFGFKAMFLFGSAAGVVMDGLITLIASSVHKKFVPHGQVAAWTAVLRGLSIQEIVEGLVCGITGPFFDALLVFSEFLLVLIVVFSIFYRNCFE